MSDMSDIKLLAGEAYDCFTSKLRDNGDCFYVLKDGAPEWVKEIVHAAHGDDFLPDDWRYQWAMEACGFIFDTHDPKDGALEFADQSVDAYTGDRLRWLSSNLNRAGYCDEAAAEFGAASGIVDMIGAGQYAEALEVYGLVLGALEELATEDAA